MVRAILDDVRDAHIAWSSRSNKGRSNTVRWRAESWLTGYRRVLIPNISGSMMAHRAAHANRAWAHRLSRALDEDG